MKLSDVLTVLERLAPPALAEGWDKVGLAVGDLTGRGRDVRRGLLCIDLTEAVLDEAIAAKAELIVAYHPPIFEPLAAITSHDPRQCLILRAVEHRIAVYSPHTALDAAADGVNDWLAQGIMGGQRGKAAADVRAIRPAGDTAVGQVKIVTFVPKQAVDAVRAAMSRAGAGRIGAYSECSFESDGEGTFRGDASTNPAVGRAGRFERVEERRLEMVCPTARVGETVAALREAHPYEQPAIDVYPLRPAFEDEQTVAVGQGRICSLARPLTMGTLLSLIKRRLGVRLLEVAEPAGQTKVACIGICAGAGGSLLAEADAVARTAWGGGIDVFFTGEMRHHDLLAARGRGIAVVLAGHTQTERPYLSVLRRRLAKAIGGLHWTVSKADRPPARLR